MKESFWGIFVIILGVTAISIVFVFQNITTSDEHNYHILKETTEAAMIDAVDIAAYKRSGVIRMDREKFVENFIRRFAESASLSQTYTVKIYDVAEFPPKVSIQLSSRAGGEVDGTDFEFDISNRLDAILETPY